MTPDPIKLGDKIAGVPTEPLILAAVIVVVGAILLPFIKLSTYFPGQSKWVYGGIWFVIGAAIAAFGVAGGRGITRTIALGASMAFFVAAFLQWAGWTYKAGA